MNVGGHKDGPHSHGGSAPQYGFSPPPYSPGVPGPAPPPVTIIQAPASLPLGPDSSRVTCPSCGATITTRVEQETTTKTHLICLIMCVFGLWPCCIVPYFMDTCKNTNHYCSSCGCFLGEYKR